MEGQSGRQRQADGRAALADEAGGGRVGLDVLLGVSLNEVPQLPEEGGVEDVEGLGGAAPPALRVGAEQVVVRAPVPLQRGEGGKGGSQKTPADFKTDPHAPANVSRDQQRPPRYWLKQTVTREKGLAKWNGC